MNPSQVKMVGWSGLAYAIMIVVTFIVTIAFAASMISTAMKAGQAPASTSTPIVTQIVSLIANLVFCWMIFGVANYLTKVRNVSAVMPIGMVIIVLVILEIIGGFVGVRGVSFNMTGAGIFAIVMLVIMIAKGILLIIFGVKALGGGSGAWKAFGILVIIAGALTAIIVGLIIAPFVWIAAGIVLMVAAFGSAKAPAAA